MNKKPAITLITGLSGAGLSSVLKTLEDMGMEAFDNLPLGLIETLISGTDQGNKPIAIGVDTRSRGFDAAALLKMRDTLGAKLLFLTCDDAELQRRFSETRRRHPLANDKPVHIGIAQERTLLKDVQANADMALDTTDLSIHDLRHILEGKFETQSDAKLTITMMSFGFKHGLPREADIVIDVRFLKNPHWDEKLRPLNGKNAAVGEYIEKDEGFADFIENFKTLIAPLLPRYEREGKNYLTIAIGCMGGRHRSVYTAELLAKWLESQQKSVYIDHRDLKV